MGAKQPYREETLCALLSYSLFLAPTKLTREVAIARDRERGKNIGTQRHMCGCRHDRVFHGYEAVRGGIG